MMGICRPNLGPSTDGAPKGRGQWTGSPGPWWAAMGWGCSFRGRLSVGDREVGGLRSSCCCRGWCLKGQVGLLPHRPSTAVGPICVRQAGSDTVLGGGSLRGHLTGSLFGKAHAGSGLLAAPGANRAWDSPQPCPLLTWVSSFPWLCRAAGRLATAHTWGPSAPPLARQLGHRQQALSRADTLLLCAQPLMATMSPWGHARAGAALVWVPCLKGVAKGGPGRRLGAVTLGWRPLWVCVGLTFHWALSPNVTSGGLWRSPLAPRGADCGLDSQMSPGRAAAQDDHIHGHTREGLCPAPSHEERLGREPPLLRAWRRVVSISYCASQPGPACGVDSEDGRWDTHSPGVLGSLCSCQTPRTSLCAPGSIALPLPSAPPLPSTESSSLWSPTESPSQPWA